MLRNLQSLGATARGILGNLFHKAKTGLTKWAKETFPRFFQDEDRIVDTPEMREQRRRAEQEAFYKRNPGFGGYAKDGKDVMVTKPIQPRILPQPVKMPDALDALFGTEQSEMIPVAI